MPTERSDRLFDSYLEGSTRFDYFMVAVAVGLLGYLAPRYQAVAIGWNSPTVELASLIALLSSVICGLIRLEAALTVTRLNHQLLYQQEAQGSLTAAAQLGSTTINHSTGEILGPQQTLARANYHQVGVEIIREHLDGAIVSAGRWYRSRDVLLVAGLCLMIAARILSAYF